MRCESRSFWHNIRKCATSTTRFLKARRVAEALHLFTLAPSLGGVESLVSIPVLTSHAMISPEQRRKMGVTEQLIRLAVGIESAEDLIADLDQALTVVKSVPQHAEVG
jgi:cystathionine beta-lyase/cystathionine gamma-synthase